MTTLLDLREGFRKRHFAWTECMSCVCSWRVCACVCLFVVFGGGGRGGAGEERGVEVIGRE